MNIEKTDVLLAYPPEDFSPGGFHKDFHHGIGGPPLGILYLASYLRAKGLSARIYDARVDFDFSKVLDHQPNALFRLGATDELITERIKTFKPKIIGVSCLFIVRLQQCFDFCNLVKKIDPNVLVVMGGGSCSALKTEIFERCQNIDAIVLGEGEEIFHELVQRYLQGRDFDNIPSIAYKKNGKVLYGELIPATVENLDLLPEPDFELLAMERYFKLADLDLLPRLSWIGPQLDRAIPIITSRGCPYKCVFCQIRHHNTTKWRGEAPSRIVDRMIRLKKRYGATHFYIEDDASNISESRFIQMLDLIIEKNLNITWSAPNGIRAEGMTDDVVRKCVDSGCISLQVGVESGDQWTLDNIVKKNLDLKKVVEGIRNCNRQRLDVGAFFIIGFPGETKRQIFNTIKLMFKLNLLYACRIHLHFAGLEKGTELFNITEKMGVIRTIKPKWSILYLLIGKPSEAKEKMVIETPEFTHNYVNRLQIIVSLITFLVLLLHSLLNMFLTRKVFRKIAFLNSNLDKKKNVIYKKLSFRKMFKLTMFRYMVFPNMINRI